MSLAYQNKIWFSSDLLSPAPPHKHVFSIAVELSKQIALHKFGVSFYIYLKLYYIYDNRATTWDVVVTELTP